MTTPAAPSGRKRPRRLMVLGVVLLALLALLTTCVVAAQMGGHGGDDRGTSAEPTAPSRASLGSSRSPTPEDSGPPATPWRQASWRAAIKKNQIIGLAVPPEPSPTKARKDPLRVSIALLAGLDTTNADAWTAGVNPLRGYMSPNLAKTYTPAKRSSGDGEDPGGGDPEKLPHGAKAAFEFYCHVASHAKNSVVSQCGYHVRTTSSGRMLRDEDGIEQMVTAKLAKDGWRVSRLDPVAGPGGD